MKENLFLICTKNGKPTIYATIPWYDRVIAKSYREDKILVYEFDINDNLILIRVLTDENNSMIMYIYNEKSQIICTTNNVFNNQLEANLKFYEGDFLVKSENYSSATRMPDERQILLYYKNGLLKNKKIYRMRNGAGKLNLFKEEYYKYTYW